jgi:hypothetical protein
VPLNSKVQKWLHHSWFSSFSDHFASTSTPILNLSCLKHLEWFLFHSLFAVDIKVTLFIKCSNFMVPVDKIIQKCQKCSI